MAIHSKSCEVESAQFSQDVQIVGFCKVLRSDTTRDVPLSVVVRTQ